MKSFVPLSFAFVLSLAPKTNPSDGKIKQFSIFLINSDFISKNQGIYKTLFSTVGHLRAHILCHCGLEHPQHQTQNWKKPNDKTHSNPRVLTNQTKRRLNNYHLGIKFEADWQWPEERLSDMNSVHIFAAIFDAIYIIISASLHPHQFGTTLKNREKWKDAKLL